MTDSVKCSSCRKPIPELPEGVEVPDPPYSLKDSIFDQASGVMVLTSIVINAYCKRCANSVGITLEQYLKKVAKPKN